LGTTKKAENNEHPALGADNAWDFVAALGFGWNLGNTLDATRNNPNVTPWRQETAWGNPVTREEVAILLRETGFDIFRVPVTWKDFLGPAPDFTVRPEWMARVRQVVDYGIGNGLVVILNLHHEDWHFPSEENYEDARAILVALWTQIAEEFRDYDNMLIFEAMNEPRLFGTPYEWNGGNPEGRDVVNRLNAAFVETVRATGGNNAARMLLLPTYAASAEEIAMAEFVMPPDDPRLIVSIHAYVPYRFALSGDYVREWSADNPADTRPIDMLFQRMYRHFLSQGIPVILGEMGARWREGGNLEYRVAWTEYYAAKGREYGVPLVWWDNGAFSGRGEVFGLMDRHNFTWVYPEIVDAFLKGR
jgi:endoglucanase